MAGYWPRSFFACLWTGTKSRSKILQKQNEAYIQPSVKLFKLRQTFLFQLFTEAYGIALRDLKRGEEQNREEGEIAQVKLLRGRNRGKKQGGGRKINGTVQGGGEIGSKGREEGVIGSESREKGDLPPCSPPPLNHDQICTPRSIF